MIKKTVNIISLGCPRNLVDSEVMLGLLKKAGFSISQEIEGTDTVIVNTCAFIEDAKTESVDVILQLIDSKKRGQIANLIVSGCLAQRYKKALADELKEVDGFIGVGDIQAIAGIVKSISRRKKIIKVKKRPKFLYDHTSPRILITPSHYAYIKIQEGCINRCSYCVIPDLRGAYRSRSLKSVLNEAKGLLDEVSEINLIGQDTTLYGIDRYKKMILPELLEKLTAFIRKETWIRLLYTHPAHFTDELIEVIRDYPVCKYIDLPVQHVNDVILKKMNRGVSRKDIISLIDKIRSRIPGVTLRTSVIVGFPGEGDGEFGELLDFMRKIRFERLGAFVYSREEQTRAYRFKKQVPATVKKARLNEVMKLQQSISAENNTGLLDGIVRVLVDKKLEKEDNLFLGRTEADAPEVDGSVYLKAKNVKPGDFVNAKITGTLEYDLVGEMTA